ncbi:MAG: hypothetical protein JSW33_16240 [bacterium]|nr:MAG: hypothetical protein JSW33_16240 [bacterium]
MKIIKYLAIVALFATMLLSCYGPTESSPEYDKSAASSSMMTDSNRG